jgi:hypothetical protein
MRYLLMLAAAASLAACHNRSEDEVGAAPDRGDTTAVTATDTTAVPTDSTMGQRPGAADTSFVQQDSTTAPTGVDSTYTPSGNTPTDTLSQPSGDTTSTTGADTSSTSATPSDSAGMGHDSTDMSMPADSTSQNQ